MKTWLTENFDIDYPIIMAPMFLISNIEMTIQASKSGIMGCIPALNYRSPEKFEEAMEDLTNKLKGKPFGINLIVNKSNFHIKEQIDICKKYPPSFILTSLGGPKEVIKELRPLGVKIICDVIDLNYANKCADLGADALVAVNSGAGGHAGGIPLTVLVPMLKKHCPLPIISAGGIGTGTGLLSTLALGAAGISMGSPFIASKESPVNDGYKNACRDYGAKDIALTTKLSGTPCTIINTPYVQKIGLKQNPIEEFLNKNKNFKKYAKMITGFKGMKSLEKAAFSATYKSVWCAGPSIEFVNKIETVDTIITRIKTEYEKALRDLQEININ